MSLTSTGWAPNQHGAWAMIAVPFIVGCTMTARIRPLTLGDLVLGLTWVVGYFTFSAMSIFLKAAPKKRPNYYPALICYLLLSSILGMLTLWLTGLFLLWWIPFYLVLLGGSLWLVAHKKERSLFCRSLTILASCGLMLVLRFGTIQAIFTDFSITTISDLALTFAITGYFIGTVFHVKALIRERNDPASARRSIIFHMFFGLALVVMVILGWLNWAWVLVAIILLARTIVITKHAASHPLAPKQIARVELVFLAFTFILALV